MSTITKERVAEIIHAAGLEPCDYEAVFDSIKAGEIVAMARIALASLEAEPVEWRVVFKLDGQPGSDFETTFESQAKMNEVISLHERAGFSTSITPLYTAPPAPVSVPECFKRLLHHAYGMTMGHDWNKGTMAGHHRAKLCQAVDECRTAMLQGADGALTNEGTIPDNTSCKLRDAVETIRNSDIAIDAEKIFAERDALNSPVIPDGWVMVPVEPTAEMYDAGDQQLATKQVWDAMIAAAPQQEVK